jgi:hypothetical protein
MSFYIGLGMAIPGVSMHAPQPQPKSAAYFLLIFIYVIITLANTTGFQISLGGKKSKSNEEVETEDDEE